MDYNSLLDSILKVPQLSEVARKMASSTHALNLVDLNWQDILENNKIHQNHLNKLVNYSKGKPKNEDKAFVRYIQSPSNFYNVIVAGSFALSPLTNGNVSLVSRNCEPLTKIGNAMKGESQYKLHDGGRFFIDECRSSMCTYCKRSHIHYNVERMNNVWCTKLTKIFDGETIKPAFRINLEPDISHGSSFMAILHVEVASRITFGENTYKVGGRVKGMIVFQESTLYLENYDSGPPKLPAPPTLPSIEYVVDEEESVKLEEDTEEPKAKKQKTS